MTQRQFAKYVGCSIETIRKIEKGRIGLSEDLASKIAITTGVSVSWLLDNNLTVSPHSDAGRPYVRKSFEEAQAKLIDPLWSEILVETACVDYATALISSIAAAFKKGIGTAQLATFKLNNFLEGFAAEFGRDVVYPIGEIGALEQARTLKRLGEKQEAHLIAEKIKEDAAHAEAITHLGTSEGRKMFDGTQDCFISSEITPG